MAGPFIAAALALALLPGAARATLDSQGLPSVLSHQDEQHYRQIFELQEAGKWQAADKLIKQLDDQRLMGHVLFQRYMHPTAYRSRYTELKHWMDHYADHPEAKRIYRLAVKRRPANYKAPKKPVTPRATITSRFQPEIEPYRSSKSLTPSQRRRARQILRQVRHNVLRTRLTTTEKLLARAETKRVLDQVQRDQSYAKVAAGWYYYGRPDKAFKLADAAARRSGDQAPMTHWIAGLAAWRLGDLEAAARNFEGLAEATRASSWTASAGAYWAARSHLRLRQPEQMSKWLRTASAHQETFYGLLARRALGMETRFDFRPHEPTAAGLAHIDADPAGHRALGLIQVGQVELAEQELLRLKDWDSPDTMETLLALAERGKLPRLAFKLASRLDDQPHVTDDGRLEAALYPIPPWQPDSGFKVDRALVYALMRQESAFNPKAKSPDGARGLMQLMPATASYIGDRRYRGKTRDQLFDPGLNLELSQRYLSYLMNYDSVQGNLFRLTTAYNGGPGNLAKWERKIEVADDPLLFIESLPSRETRVFIERVLTNFWIYRARLGQPAPSLDAAASGTWPGYAALDGQSQEFARRAED
ncbi:MAG: lytic transglycosylase domain-containing protein [Pseudomonadota bacterium]